MFSKESDYYKDFLSPRLNNGLRDYLIFSLVPEIPGIYGKEYLEDICIDDFTPKVTNIVKSDLDSYEDILKKIAARISMLYFYLILFFYMY